MLAMMAELSKRRRQSSPALLKRNGRRRAWVLGDHRGEGETARLGRRRQSVPLGQLGFTLLEVVIALGILGMQLGVLLEVQASSLANAARSRDLTIASLLARSKMIDLEQQLFDEGFTEGSEQKEGDFADEGQPDFKWSARITEVQLDLGSITNLCGAMGEEGSGQCEAMLGSMGGPLQGITDEIGNSVRLVELKVTWPQGRYEQSMALRTLVTKNNFSLVPLGTDTSVFSGSGGAPGRGGRRNSGGGSRGRPQDLGR